MARDAPKPYNIPPQTTATSLSSVIVGRKESTSTIIEYTAVVAMAMMVYAAPFTLQAAITTGMDMINTAAPMGIGMKELITVAIPAKPPAAILFPT